MPFLYEMTTSFFEIAKETLDPILEAIDGYEILATDQHGKPEPPQHVVNKLQELSPNDFFAHVGACLSATTSLGLAYVHSLRLLGFLTQGRDTISVDNSKPDLAELFDALPVSTRQKLSKIYSQTTSHDLEMEIGTGPLPDRTNEPNSSKNRDFRATLAYWQAKGMLHESHFTSIGSGHESSIRIFIPLRSLLILDKIISDQIAPKLGRKYETIILRMTKHENGPKLNWDDGMIHVSLPRRMGRALEARWKPSITSVIRIRKSGTTKWTPGFEIPFNMCKFVDLEPETEYDVQVTHKNDVGESEPAIITITTTPQQE